MHPTSSDGAHREVRVVAQNRPAPLRQQATQGYTPTPATPLPPCCPCLRRSLCNPRTASQRGRAVHGMPDGGAAGTLGEVWRFSNGQPGCAGAMALLWRPHGVHLVPRPDACALRCLHGWWRVATMAKPCPCVAGGSGSHMPPLPWR